MRPVPLRGGWERGGVPTPGRTLGGSEDEGRVRLAFPLPNQAPGSLLGPGLGSPPSGAPAGHAGPRGVGRGRRGGEADREGPSRIGGSGEMQLVSPTHLGPGKPGGLPDLVPCLLGSPPAAWVIGAGSEKRRDE